MKNKCKIAPRDMCLGEKGALLAVVLAFAISLGSCGMRQYENTANATLPETSEKVTEVILTENGILNTASAEQTSDFAEEVGGDTAGYITDGESFIRLKTRTVLQENIGMPFGCEAVSLSIALSYYGFDTDAETLFEEHMKSGAAGEANPFYSYVGDPRDMTGYGCYAPCAVRCANSYLESCDSTLRAKDISGSTIEEINSFLWDGKPVVIWGTLDMLESSVLQVWYFGGNPIYWYSLSHCVVLSGISSDGNYYVSDPMKGNVRYKMSDVERAYKQIYSQALVIE